MPVPGRFLVDDSKKRDIYTQTTLGLVSLIQIILKNDWEFIVL